MLFVLIVPFCFRFSLLFFDVRRGRSWASLGPLVSLFAPLGCSWGSLGCSWATLGRSWGALGRSWGAFGRSWGVLGRSWGAFGALSGALGALLGAFGALLERHAKIIQKSMPKMTDFGSPKAPKMEPKSHQKRSKINAKNEAKKKPKQDGLGVVLGRSGVVLGRFLDSILLIFHWFLKGFVKIHFFQKITLQDASWTELGPSWVDFGSLFGTFVEPENAQKQS